MIVIAECSFCPNKEFEPSRQMAETGIPEAWCKWQVSPHVYLTFCRACVPRVAQFLTQKLKDTVDKVDHESYHLDFDEGGNRVVTLEANPDCPYCLAQTERELSELAAQAGGRDQYGSLNEEEM